MTLLWTKMLWKKNIKNLQIDHEKTPLYFHL